MVRDHGPVSDVKYLGVALTLPKDGHAVALCVVLKTREATHAVEPRLARKVTVAYEVLAPVDSHNVAWRWNRRGHRGTFP